MTYFGVRGVKDPSTLYRSYLPIMWVAYRPASLMMHRMIAKLHRQLALKGFDADEFCEAHIQKIIPKVNYKHQLVYPSSLNSCPYLGASDFKWE